MGSAEDLLDVYVRNPDDSLGESVWQHAEDHGLEAPTMPLFQKFKDAVAQASRNQQKRKTH